MEALLSEESLSEDAKKFDASVRMLTLREYDYLDFRYSCAVHGFTHYANANCSLMMSLLNHG